MSAPNVVCPACDTIFDGICETFSSGGEDWTGFDCEACGRFRVVGSALTDNLELRADLNRMERAALSHRLRSVVPTDEEPLITTYWLEAFQERPTLPTPAMQAANLLVVIGRHVLETGEPYQPNPATAPSAGCPNLQSMHRLLRELTERGDLRNVGNRTRVTRAGSGVTSDAFEPTLSGGSTSSKNGAAQQPAITASSPSSSGMQNWMNFLRQLSVLAFERRSGMTWLICAPWRERA